jgi:NTE family protein
MKLMTREIINTFIRKGYSFATLDYYSMNNSIVEVSINPALINSIEISGNKGISDYLVEREIMIKVGEIASAEGFIGTWNNLYNCGLFEDIIIDYSYNYYGSIDVKISMRPVGNQELNVGLAYDDERNFRVGLQFNHYNLFNSGTGVNLGVIAGEYEQHVELSVINSRIGKQDFGVSIKSYAQKRDYPSYEPDTISPNDFYMFKRSNNITQHKLGLTALLNTSIYKFGQLSIGVRQDFLRTFETGEFRDEFHSVNLLHTALAYDSENKIEFADKGYKLNLLFETNFLETGKHIPFTKIMMSARANFRLFDMILTPRVKIGAGDKTMPVEEMFRLGGIDNFYGLTIDRLVGRQIFYSSLEAKYMLPIKLFFDTYLTMRYDYGNSWDVTSEFDFDGMYNGIGGALALDTPIGPAKFAVGKSFKRKDVKGYLNEGPVVLYFYIGMKL